MASSSGSTSGSSFDVFINHRGPDVKYSFASHLYRRLVDRGLRVFLDKPEMEAGHSIRSQIEDAIRGASVHIAIFSPRYAESIWCLEELVLMIESGALILPVFYKVHPSVLRWTVKGAGVYAETLRILEKKTTHDSEIGKEKPRYGPETIQKWRNALAHVADLSGFVLSGDTDDKGKLLDNVVEQDEGELLDQVVKSVLKNVPKPLLDVARYPTGLELKLEDFEKTVLSQQQQEEEKHEQTRIVGIVGIGGVGKTTLAKKFFNSKRSCYDASSFLSDVREEAVRMSINSLQSNLIRDLKHMDIAVGRHEGIGLFQKHLKFCHSLIVLDDVDHISQLEAFLPLTDILNPHSLILVTSRDKHVLISSGISEKSIYDLKGLDALNSQILFCSHAFRKSLPPPEFADLVDRFVTASGGLPLSLKVLGAQVCGENERSFWQEILDKLDKILPDEIHDRLKISYDSLSHEVKEIFLDIACFFLGEDGDKAKRIWGNVGIRNLQNRCLLEVDGENKIKMHDHIRDIGRKIAEDGSMPGRLWHCTVNGMENMLEQGSSGTKVEVRGIKLVSHSIDYFRYAYTRWRFNSTYFSNKPELHLSSSTSLEMRLKYVGLVAAEEGYLEDILRRVQSPHLIWLRWYRCYHSSLPDWIPMKDLRVLEVDGRRLNILWPPQSQAVPLQLRELNIYAPLSEIPKSIGQLKYLERIVMNHPAPLKAPSVKMLPNEFCHLLSLKYLVFNNFSKLVSLPDSFGELINLQHIDLGGASSLQMLPNSFGNLTRLKHLSLSDCQNLTISNRTLENISSLEYLNLSYCKQVKELPPQIAHQRSLQKLYLEGTKLKELPSLIGDLCKLEVLELSSDLLEVLPVWLGDIKNLKVLSLSSSLQLKSLPDSIGLLTQLTRLKIQHCGIEYIPHLIKMNNLESLVVSKCPLWEHLFRKEVEGERETLLSLDGERPLNKLKNSNNTSMFGLKELVLSQTEEVFFDDGVCPNLQQPALSDFYELRQIGGLCGLPKLRELSIISCTKVEELPNLEMLISLERLVVNECAKLQSMPGLGQLTNLRNLTVLECREIRELPGLGQLTNLRNLTVCECREIRELPSLEHLTALEWLAIEYCEKLHSIPGLGQLTNLQSLSVGKCPEIQELPSVEHLTSLKSLCVFDWEKLQSIPGLGQLAKLQILRVSICREIRELRGVVHLTSLEFLDVWYCEMLQSIPGLGQLTKLRTLQISECREIRELVVEHLTSLASLYVNQCEKLQSIPGLGQLTNLQRLTVGECREIQELPSVEHLTSLESLYVKNCEKLQSIPRLGQLTMLQTLDVSGCREMLKLPGVEHLTLLSEVNISGLGKLKGIQGLGQLIHIRELDVSGCHEIAELPGFENLTSLEKLNVSGLGKLKSIPGLLHFTQITELDVSKCHEIAELPGLENLTSLKKLNVSGLGKLKSIQGLRNLTQIRELDVSECHEIAELPGLENLTSLKKLNVSGLGKLKSIQGLQNFTQISELDVSECHEIAELPGLENLTFLKKLNVSGLGKLKSIQGLQNFTQIRELDVSDCHEIAELPSLEHLTCLEKLNVSGLEKLKSIQGLGRLTRTTELNVCECYELQELEGVEYLMSLKILNACNCHEIAELPSLEHLTYLEKLNVSGLEKLKSIQGLGRLTQITELNVCECYELQELEGVEYLMSLKILNACKCHKLQWSEGVVEQLRQQLKDGFKYEEQRERCSCLQFLQSLCVKWFSQTQNV